MATSARPITNNYKDCSLVKLDPDDPKTPLIVMQEGFAPGDPTGRVRMFYLQHDGFWIDEIARSTLPDSDACEVVFETTAEALKTLASLHGNPMVRELPTTEADTRAYLARVRGGSPQDLLRGFLSRYRAAKARP